MKVMKFDDILLWFCYIVYKQNTIQRWAKGCTLSFLMKGDFRTTKNYRGITLTSIVGKVYYDQLLNFIESEIEKVLRKKQNIFCRKQSTISQILTICESSKEFVQKILCQHYNFYISGRHLIPYTKERWANSSSVWSPQRNYYSHNNAH